LARETTLAQRDGKRMAVAFDEFQEAARLAGKHVYKRMRAHFQIHENVSYLFLGSKEDLMRTIFAGSREAFYRFAVRYPSRRCRRKPGRST
jgi:hypothetical protein